jgi:formamidopyrimidine-DNA glycosylase
VGRRIERVDRTAKYLLVRAQGEMTAVIHLRMTGKVLRDEYVAGAPTKHTRLLIHLDDRTHLRFEDVRRFGRVWIEPTERLAELPELRNLGPDALLEPISTERLAEVARGSKRSIKVFLLDQRVLGGLGNICAIEILFRAGIAPETPSDRLSETQAARVAAIIPEYLEWAIAAQERRKLLYLGEKGAENVFAIYARTGEPCPRCATPIVRTVLGGRGTWSCPECQPSEQNRDASVS